MQGNEKRSLRQDHGPLVQIVLVTWNGVEHTLKCLHSLRQLPYQNKRIVVVDNASSDGTPERVAHHFPEVEVLPLTRNYGFAHGCNVGIEKALATGAAYVWLLNNDTTVDGQALTAQVDFAEGQGRAAVVAPKILYGDAPTRIWSAGGLMDWRLMKGAHVGIGEEDRGQYDEPREVEWATGCSLFFHRTAAEHIGLLDARFFLYLEDLDWCLRARQVGIPIYYAPQARVWHHVSSSVDTIDSRLVRYFAWRNYHLLAQKHAKGIVRARIRIDLYWCLMKSGLRWLLFPGYRHDQWYHARSRGLLDALQGRFGPATLKDVDVVHGAAQEPVITAPVG